MQIIRANIFRQFPEITFGLNTKQGLHRKPPYHFNMSTSVGDDEKLVLKNREFFAHSLGLNYNRICYHTQTHSDNIRIAEEPGKLGEGDAIITNQPNLAIAVSTADCGNIFIYEKKKRLIAGVHSGWVGTEKRILAKTIEKMKAEFNAKPKKMFVYMGPSITKKNYQVGPEFKNKFDSKYLTPKGEKFFLDLKLANYDILIEAGVPEEQIEISTLCSYRDADLLHSYRREGAKSGRAWGIINMAQKKKFW